jgi:hypothetical protein
LQLETVGDRREWNRRVAFPGELNDEDVGAGLNR